MKKIIVLLLSLQLLVPAPVFADVEFPFELQGGGDYTLDVPEGEIWTVRNEEAEMNLRLEYAGIKLQLEQTLLIKDAKIAHIIKENELQVDHLNKERQIELNYKNKVIVSLEEQVKENKSSGKLLGVPVAILTFILGGIVMGYIASGIEKN